jgi:hypothetical protein
VEGKECLVKYQGCMPGGVMAHGVMEGQDWGWAGSAGSGCAG